jgi:hypothetical protein
VRVHVYRLCTLDEAPVLASIPSVHKRSRTSHTRRCLHASMHVFFWCFSKYLSNREMDGSEENWKSETKGEFASSRKNGRLPKRFKRLKADPGNLIEVEGWLSEMDHGFGHDLRFKQEMDGCSCNHFQRCLGKKCPFAVRHQLAGRWEVSCHGV